VQLPEAWYVARTMQALEALTFEALSAPQVAAVLQVHPRTARRLLTRLADEGYLTRTDDARRLYSPTMRIVAMAGQVVDRAPLTRLALPYVARLHERTGATAHLAVPSYRAALCIVHGANGSGARAQVHELVPAHATAVGKALLSHRESWLESLLASPLDRYTPRTVVDAAAVRAEAERTRLRGYALEIGEHEEGVTGVAAPVFCGGEAVAAMGLTAQGDATVEAFAGDVVTLAQELSTTLEGHGG
jgi:DNA-binding IclR family transcriptional regulator